jgi:hypothetical protein
MGKKVENFCFRGKGCMAKDRGILNFFSESMFLIER